MKSTLSLIAAAIGLAAISATAADSPNVIIRRSAESDTPFFCYIPTAIPHAAMHAPEDLHEKWRERLPQFDDVIGKYGAPGEPCPDVGNPIAGFAAMMEHLDDEVGKLLALLEEMGVDENTLVLFTSDNGAHEEGGHDPEFWNSTGGLRGHKRDMHEGGIRAPLLARWPAAIEPGRTTGHLSCFQDVLPTAAALVDQPVPERIDGISFLPTLKGDTAAQEKHDYLYWEFCRGRSRRSFPRRRGRENGRPTARPANPPSSSTSPRTPTRARTSRIPSRSGSRKWRRSWKRPTSRCRRWSEGPARLRAPPVGTPLSAGHGRVTRYGWNGSASRR